jgi:hypothetical protein
VHVRARARRRGAVVGAVGRAGGRQGPAHFIFVCDMLLRPPL